MRIVYHPAAREEARQAYLYYDLIDASLARNFEKRLTVALESIATYPTKYRLRRYNVRRCPLVRFRHYYIAYLLHDDRIVIIAIGHASKRPYYWYHRPKEHRETH